MTDPLLQTIDALPALISSVDVDLRYVFANRAHRRWYGVDPAAMPGMLLWEVVGDDLRERMEPAVRRALAGEAIDIELELPERFDLRWVRLMVVPRREAGTIVGLSFLVTDLDRHRALSQQLDRSEAMFNNAFYAAGVGKALVDPAGIISKANPAFAAMLGYMPAELEGHNFRAITHPDDIAADVDQFEALGRGEIERYRMEKRYIDCDGRPVDALLSVSVVRTASGMPMFYVAQIIDIRDRKAAEQSLRERNAQLTLAMDVLEGGVWQLDIATGMMTVSEGCGRLLGVPAGQPLPTEVVQGAIHSEDLCIIDLAPLVRGERDRHSATFRTSGETGAQRWLRCRRQLVRDAHGAPASVLGVVVDVTEEHVHEERLAQEAVTDPLTGLLNRRGFDAALATALASRGTAAPPALLLIDLDRFKPVNDDYGHAAGDRVLREVAVRLGAAVRASDVVARLGGDEFAVLLPASERRNAEQAAARIVEALAAPYMIDLMPIALGASVGIALGGAGGASLLYERADRALYAVKREGRGAWRLAA